MKRRKCKAQSTLVYALVMGVVAAALLSARVYIKRGIEGGLKSSYDSLGEAMYNPRHTVGISVETFSIQSESSSENGLFIDRIDSHIQTRFVDENLVRDVN